MNIHFKDSCLFENLKNASLVRVEIGSTMYGTNDSGSDTDYLYIYATSENELNSFLKSHHQLQYKEDNIDHNFISLHGFLNNLINGDSTINFEVVNSDALINTPLQFLYDMRYAFNNYTIIRSYLGMGRRDIKYYFKKDTHRDQIKTLLHIYRGAIFAKSILENNFSLKNDKLLEYLHILKNIDASDYLLKKKYLTEGTKLISEYRDILNEKFNNKKLNLPKYLAIENQIKLDLNINNLMNSKIWKIYSNNLKNMNIIPFYDAFENWVNYE